MVDILSRKYVEEYIVVLSTVETDFRDKIKWESPSDPIYQNLVFVKSKFVVIGWRMTYYFANSGQAYVPAGGGLRRQLLRETHNASWIGHSEVERMRALLSRSFYWPNMEENIEAYVKTYLVCQQDKVERKKEPSLLQPLPISDRPWQSISMDFISRYSKVNGMAFVFVIIDRFSKYAVFVGAPKE